MIYNCRNYKFYISKYPKKLIIAKVFYFYTESPETLPNLTHYVFIDFGSFI